MTPRQEHLREAVRLGLDLPAFFLKWLPRTSPRGPCLLAAAEGFALCRTTARSQAHQSRTAGFARAVNFDGATIDNRRAATDQQLSCGRRPCPGKNLSLKKSRPRKKGGGEADWHQRHQLNRCHDLRRG